MEDKFYSTDNQIYDKQEDKSTPKISDVRKQVITLKKLHELKIVRENSRKAQIKDSAIIPYLYNPPMDEDKM